MNYHSNEAKAKALNINLADLSNPELWCIRNAVWDADLQRYLCPVTCSRCLRSFNELLTIALSVARKETRAVCIRCDDAAKVSSAVTNVIITG